MNKADLKKKQKEEHNYNFCERCFKNLNHIFRFDLHHIILKSEKPNHKEINNPKNLILLCSHCHNFYHEVKSRREHLIQERNLTELFGNEILSI